MPSARTDSRKTARAQKHSAAAAGVWPSHRSDHARQPRGWRVARAAPPVRRAFKKAANRCRPRALATTIRHVYTRNPAYDSESYPSEHRDWTGKDCVLDGVEGYVFSAEKPQPAGTVKLCRKNRIPGVTTPCCSLPRLRTGRHAGANNDGDTGGNDQFFESPWTGDVHPPARSAPTAFSAPDRTQCVRRRLVPCGTRLSRNDPIAR